MKYPFTFYVKSLPENVGGRTNGPIIRISDKYKDDVGLYKHELIHVKQWASISILFSIIICAIIYFLNLHQDYYSLAYFSMTIHSLLYKFVPRYRLYAEVQVYKEQLKYYPDDRTKFFISYIMSHYDLKYSLEQIKNEMMIK